MNHYQNIDELTHAVIGCAMEVHNVLVPGFLESIYQNALALELAAKKINFEQAIKLHVRYKGRYLGDYEADMKVEDCVLLELKAVSTLLVQHEAQLVNYLRATGIGTGLLINFGHRSLQVKRKFAQSRPSISSSCES
jgi:GxxExxY protein